MGEPMESIMRFGYGDDDVEHVVKEPLLTLNQGKEKVRVFGHWGQTAYSTGTFQGEVCQYCGGSIDRHSSVPMIEVDSARDHRPISDHETSQLEVKINEVLLSVVGFACSHDACKIRQNQATARVHQLLSQVLSLEVLAKDLAIIGKKPEFCLHPEDLIVQLFRTCVR